MAKAMKGAAFLVVAGLIAVAPHKGVSAEQWPQFRGPGSTGVTESTGLPETWSTSQNVRWKTTIPGHGWSSPIASGDRIFVTSVIPSGQVEAPRGGLYFGGERPAPTVEHRWMVYAIDWNTGKIVWEREAHRGIPPASRHLKNTYASETPTTDGQRLYVSFGNVGLVRLRLQRQATVVDALPVEADAQRLGHGGVAGAAQRAAVPCQRQRRRLVLDRARCRNGQDDLAGRA